MPPNSMLQLSGTSRLHTVWEFSISFNGSAGIQDPPTLPNNTSFLMNFLDKINLIHKSKPHFNTEIKMLQKNFEHSITD